MIYLAGVYVAMVIIVYMCEYRKFRDYYSCEIEHLLSMLNIRMDSYSFMIPATLMISAFSWVAVVYAILMIIDCYHGIEKTKNKHIQNEND